MPIVNFAMGIFIGGIMAAAIISAETNSTHVPIFTNEQAAQAIDCLAREGE